MPARLSRARRVALQNALTEYDLGAAQWRHLIATIEDGLHQYWQQQKQTLRLRRSFGPVRTQFRLVQRHSRELRRRLPITVVRQAVYEKELALVETLKQFEDEWRGTLARMTDRGRPADADLSWFALAVVTALDQAGVPLNVGRKTAVVEVLGLVRQWAQKSRSSAPWRSVDYEFSRVIVNAYRTNPH
jgi:hypothetical protein